MPARAQIYVQLFPEGGRRWQISTEGGCCPRWSPDGRELFYQGVPDWGMVFAVQLATEPELTVGTPRMLFEALRVEGISFSFDVTPDGQRFIMIWGDEEAADWRGVDAA